ncbi:MAG: DUF3006 domain-containing protein [Blastocatellia bacterium]|nr:DUF3006 domain-containing protein [Blastocatellia bacterium]MBL8195808.1 DUF3006 domain-containing protein [Blastocatellia bacterium]MBN8725434.1 DUF3006 domain-containing protein [Acidobacteriota bacterium]
MKVFIDRIESNIAVMLIVNREEINLDIPLEYLPEGSRAGDYFDISFTVDPASRSSVEERTKDLLKELTKDSDPDQTDFKL